MTMAQAQPAKSPSAASASFTEAKNPQGGADGAPRGGHIVVRNLTKKYGPLTVFDGIDLEVHDREIVALVGPSGCGKTTLLRCIDGLIPAEGTIELDGARVTTPPDKMAMVFQHFGLFPWKTVYDNVAYGLRMAGASAATLAERVPRYIELVGLAGFEKAYPYQMSGGMQQRCGLARALAIGPRVLLMDEPFAAVDAQTREILQFELLRIWSEQPTTMVFVTHSIEEAVLMGHRVVVLKGRPSHVHEVIDVDLPHPRTRDTLRLPRFAELREQVWGTLMSEARQAEFHLET
ncbi:MAG TPA: ABC transporter ATP-binding protein [Xanthobacteraceae bacterium]|jgi:NitT/TauT family transport system ATP-binding protein|nr:ABC transporter ATP-binding protein [Xanthobacteraceae bacterium]